MKFEFVFYISLSSHLVYLKDIVRTIVRLWNQVLTKLVFLFKINKLAWNTHSLTKLVQSLFPGRKFEINHVLNYGKTEWKIILSGENKAITTNFSWHCGKYKEEMEKIKMEWYLLFFFSQPVENNNKIVFLICTKI
jgi:hypothetical protein